jgi:adenosylcobyric acid synthase
VQVRWSIAPAEIAAADLVVLPGSRSAVADLDWLHRTGIAAAVLERAQRGRPVLGICGGYQMLAGELTDEVESRAGTVAGLGLLPVRVQFERDKTVRPASGQAYGQAVSTGYEIHHGQVLPDGSGRGQPFLDGFRHGCVWGTTWHGAWESDGFRRAFLREVAELAGSGYAPSGEVRFAEVRQLRLDALADLVADHLDTAALRALITGGPPAGLPVLPPGASW